MTVRIDEIETDIEVRGAGHERAAPGAARAPAWQAMEDVRRLMDRQREDDARTRSWDHDD